MSTQPRLVEVRQNVLKQMICWRAALRQRFRDAGVRVISLVSSPGPAKPCCWKKLLTELRLAATCRCSGRRPGHGK